MGSGGDDNLASGNATTAIRGYRGDNALIKRVILFEAGQGRKVTAAMIIHDALEPWRRADAERAKERGSGDGQ